MDDASKFLLVFGASVALPLVLSWLFNPTKANEERLAAWRAEAERAFSALDKPCANPAYEFKGDMADVVHQIEEIGRDDGGRLSSYKLTRFARNEAGEYFMYICYGDAADAGFFKHVSHGNAKAVLKKKYIAPPAQR